MCVCVFVRGKMAHAIGLELQPGERERKSPLPLAHSLVSELFLPSRGVDHLRPGRKSPDRPASVSLFPPPAYLQIWNSSARMKELMDFRASHFLFPQRK